MPSTLPEVGAPDVVYIVDLSGYIFRAYHAITTQMTSPTGEPTSTTLGTVTMLQRMLLDRKPAYLAVTMDSKSATFRRDIDPNYKAHRPPPPDDLVRQIVRCREVVEAYRMPLLQREGFEADDLIATVVRRVREHKLRAVIVSADKDLMQLVGDDVVMWDTMRNRVYGPAEVQEKFGVPPSQIRDFLALTGDTSDNIPGVPSVGPKTAAELLTAHGTIESLYKNLPQVTRKKLREALEANHASALLSQRLVTLRDDLDDVVTPESLTPGKPDEPRLQQLFTELGFARLLASVSGAGGPGAAKPSPKPEASTVKRTYRSITTRRELEDFVEAAAKAPALGVDTETTGIDALAAGLVGISLAIDPGEGFYVPVGHTWKHEHPPAQLTLAEVRETLGPLLAADVPPKVGHHMKYDETVLGRHGLSVGAVSFDTMLASYLLDPEAQHGLKELARRELDETMTTYDEVTGKAKGSKQLPFAEVALEAATSYAGADAALSLDLAQRLAPRLEADGFSKLMTDIELPLTRTLVEMEGHGVLVDTQVLKGIGEMVDKKLVELEARAKEIAGRDFNVNAPRQLETLLFDELGLPVIKRTKTSRSTDAEVLEALSDKHPLPAVILEIRQLAKLKGTYIDALPALVRPETGRIHTTYNQAIAATGRLSSTDPNLQNIPVRTDVGRAIRSAFVAPKGHELMSADYSQIELRVLAHLSRDPVLVEAFTTGEDIHTRTALEIFGVTKDAVTPDMRRAAKTINFGVIYGMGDSALSKRLGIERAEAGRFIDAYFTRYAGVKKYFDQVLEEARGAGSVGTMLGRRRFVPDIGSANRGLRMQAERIAQNTPIQGTSADILKLAMVKLRRPVAAGVRMLLTVHDELVFEVPEGAVTEAAAAVKSAMEGVVKLSVPLVVEVGHGRTWADAHS